MLCENETGSLNPFPFFSPYKPLVCPISPLHPPSTTMKYSTKTLALSALLLLSTAVVAQSPTRLTSTRTTTSSSTTSLSTALPTGIAGPPERCPAAAISNYGGNGTCPCPDVYLNVPDLSVQLIELTVKDLQAHVSLNVSVNWGMEHTATYKN